VSEPVNERESQELARLAATWQDRIDRIAEVMRQASATASQAMEDLAAAFSACVEGDEEEPQLPSLGDPFPAPDRVMLEEEPEHFA